MGNMEERELGMNRGGEEDRGMERRESKRNGRGEEARRIWRRGSWGNREEGKLVE